MRIKENDYDGHELVSSLLQKRVWDVFWYTSKITEMRNLLSEIKKDSANLPETFLTEAEQEESNKIIDTFAEKMQMTVYNTINNLEGYYQYAWRELMDEGGNSNG